jgi:molybdopterin molybdotransferase
MKSFFKVTDIDAVLSLAPTFAPVSTEQVALDEALGRVLAEDAVADENLPGFDRSTMDGYAVAAASTYGASEQNPAMLNVVGEVGMGQVPEQRIARGEAVRIATGAMLPEGADAVVMIEHSEALDALTIEVYRSVAPGQHMVFADEDIAQGAVAVAAGTVLRAQECGLLAALGCGSISVFQKPRVGIISTGDEVVALDQRPRPGQVRDVNTTTLSNLVRSCGGQPATYGILADDFEQLYQTCAKAVAETQMVMISGGSSVGMRDLTVEVLQALPDTELLVHGISIRPGKPTILARSGDKPFWGMPGHTVSAMIVFAAVVRPFLRHLGGLGGRLRQRRPWSAVLTRNLASAQGRVDFVRVRLVEKEDELLAEPILGKSGLIRTMVAADGLVVIDRDLEGLEKGQAVAVYSLD